MNILLHLMISSVLLQSVPDFHLKAGSPAIGMAICLPEVPFDADGVRRPNRPPNTLFPGDTGCEIGAYQFVLPTVTIPILSITVKPQ